MSGASRAPVVNILATLDTELLITVRSGLVERAPLLLTISFLPRISSPHSMTRGVLNPLRLSMLIDPMPALLGLKGGLVLYEVSDARVVILLDATAAVLGRLHGDTATWDYLGVGRAREIVNVRGVHHVPAAVQSELPLFLAGEMYPLILGKKSLKECLRTACLESSAPYP